MKGKVIVVLSLMAFYANECSSSAIPMWEFLSRDEKMSHLYSMFAKQVQSYCKGKTDGSAAQCKKNMMLYGITKLNDMEESHLDKMDPYQRNANNILWDSMMDGHADANDDERQQHLQREQYKQQNPLFKDEVATGNEETPDMKNTDQYEDDDHNNYLYAATNYNYAYVNKPVDLDTNEHLEQNTNFLSGPSVVYMMPDGSPVKAMVQQALPVDDDREDMTMGRKRMPMTMQQVYDSIRTMDEEPKIIIASPPATSTTSEDDAYASSRTIRTLYGNYRIH